MPGTIYFSSISHEVCYLCSPFIGRRFICGFGEFAIPLQLGTSGMYGFLSIDSFHLRCLEWSRACEITRKMLQNTNKKNILEHSCWLQSAGVASELRQGDKKLIQKVESPIYGCFYLHVKRTSLPLVFAPPPSQAHPSSN